MVQRKSRLMAQEKGRNSALIRPRSTLPDGADPAEEIRLLAARLERPFQGKDDLDFFTDKRMSGSCGWLLDEPVLAEFLQEPKQTRVLWCTGRPGSGKSVFAASVINHLRSKEARCAFHFFRFGNDVQNGLSTFLIAVAFQLARQIAPYRTRLLRMFDQGLSLQRSAPRLIWQRLFVSTLFKMGVPKPLYVVVDGLDEGEHTSLLLKLLGDLPGSKTIMCLLLVSRKTQAISSGIEKISKSVEVSNFSLDDTDEDLRMYVEEEMQSMRGDQIFRDRISDRILAKADGNFLWANLVLKEVLQCHTETEIEDALNDVPEDLEHLYARMDATLAQNSRPADTAMARTIFTWAVCCRHRLTLEQLGDALKPEYAEVLDLRMTISQVCGEFIVVDAKGVVSMMHATARDFLTETKTLNFYIPERESHQRIFAKCVSELIAASTKIQLGQVQPGSFLSYAAQSWPHHLGKSLAHLDQESLMLLAQFFRGQSVLSWIYLLCMAGELGVLVHASKTLTTFLKQVDRLDNERSPLTHKLQEKDALGSWATDLVRLVGKFGTHLKAQPKSIYKLVPAFCPPASAMYKTFCSKIQASGITISGLSNTSWDDCLAKFQIAGKCYPVAVTCINKHFAILTSDGLVRLYTSSTLEEGRQFKHGERVLAWCFNQAGDKLATYGFKTTVVWNVASGLQLLSVPNPETSKAVTIGFTNNDDAVITCSDDRMVRIVSLTDSKCVWEILDNVFGSDALDVNHHNSPRCAAFNALGSQLAIAYRGFALSVWSVEEPRPCLVGRCERPASGGQMANGTFVDTQSICWNAVTGHIMGVYNDGCIFKWHPFDGDYQESNISGSDIKCSPDGKFFVTSSADGAIRVWDFQHFSPIYQLSCSSSVTDLALDPVERRIYDLRDNFCHIWEPNSLLRQWETDDKASETTSTRESSTQVSVCADASTETLEPLTALAVDPNSLNFVAGNDEGVVNYFNCDGELLCELSQTFMTIEHLCWSGTGTRVASSDLSRRVTVKGVDHANPHSPPKGLLTVKIDDQIKQLLLSPLGDFLLVSTDKCLTIWSVDKQELVSSRPQDECYYWANSPSDPDQLIGFGYSELHISMWEGLGTIWELHIDRSAVDGIATTHGLHAMFPKPTAAQHTRDADTVYAVDKVLFTLDGNSALVETSKCSHTYNWREKQFLLLPVDAASITAALGTRALTIAPSILPPELISHLGLPLGFVAADPAHSLRRKSFTPSSTTNGSTPNRASTADTLAPTPRSNLLTPATAMSTTGNKTDSWRSSSSTFLLPDPSPAFSTPGLNASSAPVLAFLDHEYWVCTYTLPSTQVSTSSHGTASTVGAAGGRVRRHHFLPRDWISMDCLELAVMTSEGRLLCPRNGEAAVVRGGLSGEVRD